MNNSHYRIHILFVFFIFSVFLTSTYHSYLYAAEEEKDRLLVVPLKAKKGIGQDEASILTDILSVEIIRSGIFTVLNRDDMKAMLSEKEFEQAMGCDEDNICLLQNVAKLSVSKVIAGSIGALGKKYIVSIKLINKDGQTERMLKESCSCPIEDLEKTIETISYRFLKRLGGDVAQDGSIRVESEPRGAKIYLDGDSIGITPDSIRRIIPGTHKVEVKMDGYKVWTKRVSVEAGEEASILARLEQDKPDLFTDSVTGMEFVFVQGGCYQMGDRFGDGEDDEKSVHEVCVDDFYIGKYEVTIAEFGMFISDSGYRTDAEKKGWAYVINSSGDGWEKRDGINWQNAGFAQDGKHPVVNISWNDAMAYIEWLNRKTDKRYRLPTEAEWEYSARSGGKRNKYSWGNYGIPEGNIAGDEVKRRFPKRPFPVWEGYDDGYVFTAPVGSFKPNELGLYDMTGNVWEWCSDWYGKDYYKSSPKHNPKGASSGSYRVFRGGSWGDGPRYVRASDRFGYTPDLRYLGFLGFRLARTP